MGVTVGMSPILVVNSCERKSVWLGVSTAGGICGAVAKYCVERLSWGGKGCKLFISACAVGVSDGTDPDSILKLFGGIDNPY